MPGQLMENLVESKSRAISTRSVMAKLVSACIQIGGIALLVVIPLLATDSVPEPPEAMRAFLVPPPPAPPPPPATRAAAPEPKPEAPARPTIPKPVPSADFLAPMEVPDEIPGADLGHAGVFDAGGVDTSGVPEGSLAGVEGGMPGAPIVEPIRVGGDIEPPKKLKDVRPAYPVTAQYARVEGAVILEAVIDARGVVVDVRVLKSIPLLDAAAVEAVEQWRYQATMLNGEAVPIVMTVTVHFALDKA